MVGTAEKAPTRSLRIHSARPSGSVRSIATTVRPSSHGASTSSTIRFRIVSGSTAPCRVPSGTRRVRLRDRARQQQVVRAVHGALRKARGAARVRDRRGREGIARDGGPRRRSPPRSARPRAVAPRPARRRSRARARAARLRRELAPRARRASRTRARPSRAAGSAFSGGASSRFTPTQSAPSRCVARNRTGRCTSFGRHTATRAPGVDAERRERVRGAVRRARRAPRT